MDQLPRLGKRKIICLLLFTQYNYLVSVGEVSSSSGCLGWATLFYCGTPSAFHIIIIQRCVKSVSNSTFNTAYHIVQQPLPGGKHYFTKIYLLGSLKTRI